MHGRPLRIARWLVARTLVLQQRTRHLVGADIAQREGRILRQGNQNPEVRISQVVTKESFDSFMWQGLERKSRFINQIMRGRLDVREIEDVGENTLSFAEVKALASGGNPLVLEKAVADQELARLSRLDRAYNRNMVAVAHTKRGEQSAADAASGQRRRGHGCRRLRDRDMNLVLINIGNEPIGNNAVTPGWTEATSAAIRRAAGECLKRVPLERRIRLLGVRVASCRRRSPLSCNGRRPSTRRAEGVIPLRPG